MCETGGGKVSLDTLRKNLPVPKTKDPDAALTTSGSKTWRQPTLAGPNVQLPSAARGLTAVFGMGTGGTPGI